MPEAQESFGIGGQIQGSAPGPVPTSPTPPATAATALPGTVPTLGLGLQNIILIVAGDITVTANIPNATIIRR